MVQIYPQLSVLSNLLIAIQEHQERSVLGRILRTGKIQQAEVVAMERANYVMREFGLESLRDVPAGSSHTGSGSSSIRGSPDARS